MKPKITAILLCAALVFCSLSFSACSDKTEGGDAPDVSEYSEYNYDLSQYLTLAEYKGLSATDNGVAEVTDEDVQDEISAAIEQYTTTEQITDRAVAVGDTVNLDYVGRVNGEEMENGSDSGFDLTIGSGAFIEDFENGVVGMMPGTTDTVDATFSDPYTYNEELSGVTVQFEITVNYIAKEIVPEYNDAFVAANLSDIATTTADYEQYLRETLKKQNESDRTSDIINQVWTQVSDNTTIIEYPETEYTHKYDEAMAYYNDIVSSYYDMELEEFLTTYQNTTLEDFKTEVSDYVYATMKEEMILWSIIRAEGLSVSEEEYTAGLEEYAEYYSITTDEMITQYGEETIRKNLLWDKAFLFLQENAVLTEATKTTAAAE